MSKPVILTLFLWGLVWILFYVNSGYFVVATFMVGVAMPLCGAVSLLCDRFLGIGGQQYGMVQAQEEVECSINCSA